MRPMVQGTEHEYTMYSEKLNPRGFDPHRMALDLLWRSELHAGGEFLQNGSRAYFDVGHLEISTSEVLDPRGIVLYEKAGEHIVNVARSALEDAHGVKVSVYKNNTDPDGVSYGSHENYCVPRKTPFPDAYIKALVPHLVSRIIYTGAGDWIDHQYVISPCAYLTSQLISGGNLSNTGILHTRDEPHADPEKYRRLHVIIGDALMAEWPLMLRHFTTQAILQLMEDGELDDAPKLANPLEDMWHMVEHLEPDQWRISVGEDELMTPMQIQRYYLEKVEPLVESEWEKKAFQAWEQILDQFEGNFEPAKMAPRVEWISRLIEMNRQVEIKGGEEFVEVAACKQYSEISPRSSLYHRRLQDGLIDRVVTDDEIKAAVKTPPPTRAEARVDLLNDYEVATVDWSEVRVLTEDGGTVRVSLPDPYATEVNL